MFYAAYLTGKGAKRQGEKNRDGWMDRPGEGIDCLSVFCPGWEGQSEILWNGKRDGLGGVLAGLVVPGEQGERGRDGFAAWIVMEERHGSQGPRLPRDQFFIVIVATAGMDVCEAVI